MQPESKSEQRREKRSNREETPRSAENRDRMRSKPQQQREEVQRDENERRDQRNQSGLTSKKQRDKTHVSEEESRYVREKEWEVRNKQRNTNEQNEL